MAYAYETFNLVGDDTTYLIEEFIAKLKEIVPNINIEGPFEYEHGTTQGPSARTYILTHTQDGSFKMVLHNTYNYYLDENGKPTDIEGFYEQINVEVIMDGNMITLPVISVGSDYGKDDFNKGGNPLYVAVLAGEDYLFWEIDDYPLQSCPIFNVVYMPMYNADGSLYALMYPGLLAYEANNRDVRRIITYKDTLKTNGKNMPNSKQYGIGIKVIENYVSPQFDITKPCTEGNIQPMLTTKVPLHIKNYYGTQYTPDGEAVLTMESGFYGKTCFLAVKPQQVYRYPKGSILVIDGKDYYVSYVEEPSYLMTDHVYHLFEL